MNSYLKKRISQFLIWTAILIVLALMLSSGVFVSRAQVFLMTAFVPWGISILMLIGYPTSGFVFNQAAAESAVLAISPELAYCDPEKPNE